MTDAPPDYVEMMLKAIVGFAIPLARLEGKWKMSQNRPPADRKGTADVLRREGKGAVADAVEKPRPA